MKPVSRFVASVPVARRTEAPAPPKSSGRCDDCGWDFSIPHIEKLDKKGGGTRKVTRDQINQTKWDSGTLIAVVTRCGDCYERRLFNAKRSRWSGCEPVEALHRSSLNKTMLEDHW